MNKRSGLRILLLLSSLALLTGCDDVGENIGNTIKENLFGNIYAMLAQIVATVVLLVLIIVFAYKPAKKFLDKRRELLNNEVKETKEKNIEADKNLSVSKESIKASKIKAQEIIEKAEADANIRRDEIIAETEQETKKMISDAQNVIKKQQEQALNEIKDVVVGVALDASSRILEREVSEQDNQKIIDDFVNEVKDENKDK